MFPAWPNYSEEMRQPHGSMETGYAEYYYHCYEGFDYTYDIYAQWPIEGYAFTQEVNRVTALFNETAKEGVYNYRFVEMDKGEYRCLILYADYGAAPFTEVTDSYDCLIFAYN